jgi:arginyl-tRNA synthetase
MTLQQMLKPAIEKAIHVLFDVTIDKIEFQTTRKNLKAISQWLFFRC